MSETVREVAERDIGNTDVSALPAETIGLEGDKAWSACFAAFMRLFGDLPIVSCGDASFVLKVDREELGVELNRMDEVFRDEVNPVEWCHMSQTWRDHYLSCIDAILAALDFREIGELRVVFDGSPGAVSGRFVEVETPDGASVNAGEWHERDDGLWELRIAHAILKPTGKEK